MNDPLNAYRKARQARGTFGNRPYVCLSYAQSLDGSIAARAGEPYRISSEPSMTMTHQLRSEHDAILIGIGTALADDPRLTVRHVRAGKDPAPVIMDSHLRLRPNSRVFEGEREVHIFTSEPVDPDKVYQLERRGGRVHVVPKDRDGLLDIGSVLGQVKGLGISSIMVEGGALVITNFLLARVVDWIVLTIAPFMLGGVRAPKNTPSGLHKSPVHLNPRGWASLGSDYVIWGRPSRRSS